MILRPVPFLCLALALLACRADRPAAGRAASDDAAAPPAPERPVVLVVGTSLTAGLGVDPDQAYPALLQRKIDSAGLAYRVVNAGVSGETSAGARSRIDWLLRRQPPAVLVLETGANDGLRGLPVDSLRANIRAILDTARPADPAVRLVLVGMEAPPNLGARYTRAFRAVYPELAREYHAALVPFLLAGVAAVDSLNQSDGLHPTPAGQRIVAATVWRVLEPVLREVGREGGPNYGASSEAGKVSSRGSPASGTAKEPNPPGRRE